MKPLFSNKFYIIYIYTHTHTHILWLLQIIPQWWISCVSVHSTALMWLPQENFDWNKRGDGRRQQPKWNLTLNKRNWKSCTKLALSASWTHGLIAQSVRASERNSVVVGSNPTKADFLWLLQIILQWWISCVSVHSAAPIWLPQKNFDWNKRGDWRRQQPKWNQTLNKRWNWSSCTKLALRANWTHDLIAQSNRASVNRILWSWVQIPLRPTFYGYFK